MLLIAWTLRSVSLQRAVSKYRSSHCVGVRPDRAKRRHSQRTVRGPGTGQSLYSSD